MEQLTRSFVSNIYTTMEFYEIEVKFLLEDVETTRHRIIELGGASSGSVFESNIRFDNEQKDLQRNGSILRLRQDKKSLLTLKSRIDDAEGQFKIHKEHELEVADFKVMKQILEMLGFHKEQVYEKYRETFILKDTVLCVDTMPFGIFLEIEGSKENIRSLADRIGLPWEERILSSYIALFELLREECRLPFSDITFVNFNTVPVDLNDYRHLLKTTRQVGAVGPKHGPV